MNRDRLALQRILDRDRVWSTYAIADLDDGLFEHTEWHTSGDALVLLFRAFGSAVLFTLGDGDAVRELLRREVREPAVYLNLHLDHLSVLEGLYEIERKIEMFRMVLRDFRPEPAGVVRIGEDRLAELEGLYASDPAAGPDFFAPFQLRTGYFRGIERDGRLVAAAGVHVASRIRGVAGIGNVFTHPDWRGRGLGRAVTSAVVAALRADGIETVALNVERHNTPAIRAYQRLGFEHHCEFIEGPAKRL